ncbi:hypothetical protein [Methylomonas sp. CM2]|uniref:hypothetical protein n=1 Tax=Methylomonas sp. CM2 TaxID=3417647 RepID=UPI003CE844BF
MKAIFEAWLIRIAAKIIRGRNVQRAMVVSRADNNWMSEAGYELGKIADRIASGYKDV